MVDRVTMGIILTHSKSGMWEDIHHTGLLSWAISKHRLVIGWPDNITIDGLRLN